MDPNRQTGRTTEMLKAASAQKAKGNVILIVVHEERMIRYCRNLAYRHQIPNLLQRDFTTPRGAVQRGRMRGLLAENVFVDHFVGYNYGTDDRTMDAFYEELVRMRRISEQRQAR